MEFDIANINFGCCTIHESTKTRIRLSNRSILPQEYGFVGLPDVSNKSILPQEYGFVGLPDVSNKSILPQMALLVYQM